MLPDPDRKQAIIILPAEFVKRFPPEYVANYEPESDTVLRLNLVNPDFARGRKYSVILHHGAAQVSVPRTWLRDQHVTGEGRTLLVQTSEAQPDALFLSVAPL